MLTLYSCCFLGCGDGGHSSPSDPLEVRIRGMSTVCTNVGFKTSAWAFSVCKAIAAIDDAASRKRFANLYFEMLAQIDPLSGEASGCSRRLGNYAQLLDPYMMLIDDIDDQERPFELMSVGIQNYRLAIRRQENAERDALQQLRRQNGRKWMGRQSRLGNYQSGLDRLSIAVTNSFLLEAKERGILGNRHEYWQKRLEQEIRGCGTN